MKDFLKLLVERKVRVYMEYDDRVKGIRLFLSQEQPNRRRRGLERAWSIEQLSKLKHPEDFLDAELKDFLGAFTNDGRSTENDLLGSCRKS